MLYLGLISGTSMDAVDIALIDIDDKKISLLEFLEFPIPDEIRVPLRAINDNSPLSEVAKMDVLVGELFAEAVCHLLETKNYSAADIQAIGSHGQTIYHSPNSTPPCTIQIGDPNVIAAKTGITTVADFRRMDVANGGQGAPFAPLFHQAFFQTEQPRLILNIGGIANLTFLSEVADDPVTGFDTGPGNCLLDDWIMRHKGSTYDNNGEWARSGTTNDALLSKLLEHEYFSLSPPKSTGRDEFNLAWLDKVLRDNNFSDHPENIQRTLLQFSVKTICDAIHLSQSVHAELILCGGGVKNDYLVDMLNVSLPEHISMLSADDAGMNHSAVEASCFAWLAYNRMQRIGLALGKLTGASVAKMLPGAVYRAG